MKTARVRVDLSRPASLPKGRVDRSKLDATTEADLAVQQAQDDAEAMRDAARFVRRVRRRLGLTQQEFARRIDVPLDTIRNWEQGKRHPTGAARSLLKVLDRMPKAALSALN
ncbi:MAG: helix-turn-helix domain-containing protein [Burkholderiaceae bacterium]|nr:helix-turn-helix domain-containing protein [Burkholderiaceae bacterium]